MKPSAGFAVAVARGVAGVVAIFCARQLVEAARDVPAIHASRIDVDVLLDVVRLILTNE